MKITPLNFNSEDYVGIQDCIAVIINTLVVREIRYLLEDHPYYDKGIKFDVEVGKFDNCREYGFTYKAVNAKIPMVFCVYEHRNSDNIIINGCLESEVSSYGPYMGNKYEYLASFDYEEYGAVAKQLALFLLKSYLGEE